MKKKSILFVADHLDFGGAQTHLIDLVNSLSGEFQSSIILLSEGSALASRINSDIEIYKEIRCWKYDLSITNRIASRINKERYDFYFANSSFSYFFLCTARKKLGYDFPVNFILHSSQFHNLIDRIRYTLFIQHRLPQDKFISTCNFQKDYFSKTCHIPSNQFQTIYNGIDNEYFTLAPSSFSTNDFKLSLGIPVNAKIILQVAVFRKEKAHQYSIEALKILNEGRNKKTYLIFVGSGNELLEKQLYELTNKLGIQQYVKFCGTQENLLPYYWISDLFTLSSVAIETFSISALIAIASGLPCVLTDIGGAREMVIDGKNGFVVPPHDSNALANGWRKVIDGDVSLDSKQISKITDEKFSLDSMIRSYKALIH